MKVQKTNAVRLLDKMKIPYSLVTYTVDENDLYNGKIQTSPIQKRNIQQIVHCPL